MARGWNRDGGGQKRQVHEITRFHGTGPCRNKSAGNVLNLSWEEVRGIVDNTSMIGSRAAWDGQVVNMMDEQNAVANDVARHLHKAIERVREDMAKVEFWADAMTGFAQPVPSYEPKDVNVWTPLEQAKRISGAGQHERKPPPERRR